MTQIALNLGFVLGGAITVEALFSWPGIGLAHAPRDPEQGLPVLQGIFLVTSALVIFCQPRRRPAVRAPRPAGAHATERGIARRGRGGAPHPRRPPARRRRALRTARRRSGAPPRPVRARPAAASSPIMAIFGPVLAPQNPNAASSFSTSPRRTSNRRRARTGSGTDESGRDVLSQLLYAAPHLARRRARGRADLDAARDAGRHRRRLLRRLGRPRC